MNNEKYNQIIDEVYEKYAKDIQNQRGLRKNQNEIIEKIISIERMSSQKEWARVLPVQLLSREEFINVCKIDQEFSEKWGLKIEERELSLGERLKLLEEIYPLYYMEQQLGGNDILVRNNIPTKLITLTYNNETEGVYEI